MHVSRSAVRFWKLAKLFPANTSRGSSVSIYAAPNLEFHHEHTVRQLSSTGSDESKGDDKDLLDWRKTITGVITDSQFERDMDDFLLSKVMEEGAEHNRLTNKGLSTEPVQKTTSPNNEDVPKETKQTHSKTALSSPSWQFSNKFGTVRSKIPSSVPEPRKGGEDLLDAIAEETHQNILRLGMTDVSQITERDAQSIDFFFGPQTKTPVYSPDTLALKDDYSDLTEPTKVERTDHGVPSGIGGGFRVSVYRNITGSPKVLFNTMRKQILESVSQRVQDARDSPHLTFMQQFLDLTKPGKTNGYEDMRFRVNQMCASLLEKLPKLSPDELALVSLVFGKLGYTNSLVFSYILDELQKPQMLSSMKLDALSSTVLTLGMLQSTDSEFFGNVLTEFRHRFHARNTVAIPPYSFASLLLACCYLKAVNMAEKLCIGLLEMLCKDPAAISWNDLAVAVYVMGQLRLVQPNVLTILHTRLALKENLQDLECSACSVLLLSLEKILHVVHHRLHHPMCKDIYSLLEDHVAQLISDDQIDVTSIPDLIRSLSFPGLERVECYPILGKLLLKDGAIPANLSLWTLIYRLMSGHANLMYRDPAMLKALNTRFHEAKWARISCSTIAQLLHVGYRLRGLEESLVDRLVELMSTTAFWDQMYRAKDAARIAYSLAGFDKLTPQIFEHCWKKCAAIPFSQYNRMRPQECVDTMFIAQGLFDGYQHIRHRFSASEARKHISQQGRRDLYNMIRTKNLAESGPQTTSQKAVAEYLQEMGVQLTCPALLEDGLYRADLALHDTKVTRPFAVHRIPTVHFCHLGHCLCSGHEGILHHSALRDEWSNTDQKEILGSTQNYCERGTVSGGDLCRYVCLA